MSETPESRMRSYLRRVATGPHLSKDLTAADVRDALEAILEGSVDPVQAGVFLIALRMKRETADEYAGALAAVRAATRAGVAAVDDLVDIGDPYDGFARLLPASPFLPAVLAACGVPAVCHGCREMPPKRGLSTHRVLAAAGVDIALPPERVAARIEDPAVGWGYVGVEQSCPQLHALIPLRELIVKRPLLSTIEKLAGPVRSRTRSHLVVGFVHRGYDRLLLDLARGAGFASAIAVKGLEGGVVPSLSAATTISSYSADGRIHEQRLDPAEVGIAGDQRAASQPEGPPDLDRAAASAAEEGIGALEGASGPIRDALVHVGSAILHHLDREPTRVEAAARIRAALDDGTARARLR